MPRCFSLSAIILIWVVAPAFAGEIDLSNAKIVATGIESGPEKMAVNMLVEEVARRSWIRFETASTLPESGHAILIGNAVSIRKLLPSILHFPLGKEGYRIGIIGKTVYVAGEDARGTVFGVGRLLRELRIEREKITLPDDFKITTTPKTAIRGHQIGYRPKTNSYDGWTIAMWDQYIRDLAIFGCNTIEIIPPRSDDADDSPHFPEPPLRMMAAMSRIADSYGMDVWIWYPAMDRDYGDPKTVAAAIQEWGNVFKALPRVDAVFVPGGDPGHTPPKLLFPFLEKQTANLQSIHPKAKMWLSPQSFNAEWLADFYALMKQEPAWLSGIVHGPQVRVSLPVLRANIPAKYPIRDYPDITHSRTCQYPVPDWDVAFALTIGREGTNPRPMQMADIYRYAKPHTTGFITYSEGCHDDVNKVIWSVLGWDDQADLHEAMRQYGRLFVSPKLSEQVAEGIFALERNWIGPAFKNKGIEETLSLFQKMESTAGPREKLSWRFQQLQYRAYYDAYIRSRTLHESIISTHARNVLSDVKTVGTLKATTEALQILDQGDKLQPGGELKLRVSELAAALFQSTRAQLSVSKYHAIDVGRGANLDLIDAPLSDFSWLRQEIAAIQNLDTEQSRMERLTAMLNREDPGPGCFYDKLGDPERQPHLVRTKKYKDDPAFFESPLTAFGRAAAPDHSKIPREWWSFVETHYDTPLQLKYTGLDRRGSYSVRVVYARAEGKDTSLKANDVELHGPINKTYEPLTYAVPQSATAKGELTLTWTQPAGAGGPGRGCQVCEVWLIKKQ